MNTLEITKSEECFEKKNSSKPGEEKENSSKPGETQCTEKENSSKSEENRCLKKDTNDIFGSKIDINETVLHIVEDILVTNAELARSHISNTDVVNIDDTADEIDTEFQTASETLDIEKTDTDTGNTNIESYSTMVGEDARSDFSNTGVGIVNHLAVVIKRDKEHS